MRQHLAEAPGEHPPGDAGAGLGVGPEPRLAAGEPALVRPEGLGRVEPRAALADRDQGGAVAGQEPERVVGHAAARADQDRREGLERDRVVAGAEGRRGGRLEAQGAILDIEPAALEPDQPVPVDVRDARGLEPEPAEQHHGSGRPEQQHAEAERPMPADAAREARGKAVRIGHLQYAGHNGVWPLDPA